MTARERRRLVLAEAVRAAASKIAGTHQRQNRQEWAASRQAEGWSPRTVQDAIGAGTLAAVRAHLLKRQGNGSGPPSERLARAMQALALIDTQRELETRRGRYLSPHHRPTTVSPRIRSSD